MSKRSEFSSTVARISVARDFSPHPGPRYARQGAHSGESFRKRLVQLLRRHERILVDLDGTSGYGSSFLDEAFGGLVSKEGFSAEDVRRRVDLKSDEDETYIEEVCEAIALAQPQNAIAA